MEVGEMVSKPILAAKKIYCLFGDIAKESSIMIYS